jgi:aerobic-type carbon monoxide dehydrogenase small subunit (CoxS/CutS family)
MDAAPTDEPNQDGLPSAELELTVDGRTVRVPDDGSTLLEVLRTYAGVQSAKDGCAPQGQCGCCTVLVDGQARVSCVTPARRVAGRSVTTLDGLDAQVRDRWAAAVTACGGSQCGVCTPGIVTRLVALDDKKPGATVADAERALAAHLCRCTGWQTVVEAWELQRSGDPFAALEARDLDAATARATVECGVPQRVGTQVSLGRAGFAADTVPDGALVAVPDGEGGWTVGPTLHAARQAAGKVQGRRTTEPASPPLEVPEGEWAASLATCWVEAAYVETDASWCEPGGSSAPAAANGGAFGAKRGSELPAAARALADEHGQPVLALWSREDVARHGFKRPPVAGGMRTDGTGQIRVVAADGVAAGIAAVAPGLEVELVEVPGPPVSSAVRAAGWAEAAALVAAAGAPSDYVSVDGDAVTVVDPVHGGRATVRAADGQVQVEVDGGEVLDEVVVRSYCIGAVHMALSWVTSESLTVTPDGEVADLTVRSFGVLRAADMPHVEVVVAGDGPAEACRVSDAVFAATAAAVWRLQGCPTVWPTGTLLPASPATAG